MDCQQARNLFDAYLDGELSPALETELAAHRLNCPDCRHALALLEVVGHVVGADADHDPGLDDEFTHRLLGCLQQSQPVQRPIWVRSWFVGGSLLAAAAALALVFTLMFRGPEPRVAGEIHRNPNLSPPPVKFDEAADSMVKDFQTTWVRRIDNAQEVIEFGEMTFMQILDRLGIDEAIKPAQPFEVMPPSFDELLPATGGDGIEDL